MKERIKLLVVLRKLGVGGAEKVLVNVANNLDQESFAVTVGFVEDGEYRSLVREHVSLRRLRSKSVALLPFELKKIVEQEGFDVILHSWPKLTVLMYLTGFFNQVRSKVVFRVPISVRSQIGRSFLLNNFLFKSIFSKALQACDTIIALCSDLKRELIRDFHVDEKKVVVIYNPVDFEFILRNADEFTPFEIRDGHVNIVSAGRLEHQKGFDILLQAFKLVLQEVPNARLTILGNGKLEPVLKNLSEGLGIGASVRFMNWTLNPYPYFKNADVFVLSSRYEGFPNVLLEAMACGCKVVSTNCPTGPRELIGENEEFGWLAEVENPRSLADKILLAIGSNPKVTDRALEKFRIEYIAREYEKLLKKVMRK